MRTNVTNVFNKPMEKTITTEKNNFGFRSPKISPIETLYVYKKVM